MGDANNNSGQIGPFNPLDKSNLGTSVADALLAQQTSALPPERPFEGAGIYAIYYGGSYPLYRPVSQLNQDGKFSRPIYVGKAVPKGARKGGYGLNSPPGTVLYDRLSEHAASIQDCNSLTLSDFACRYLIVDDIWIPLGESLLIQMFSPLWNVVIDGFGNHDPGGGRYSQQRSKWDTLHPGRDWAERCQPNALSIAEIEAAAKAYLQSQSGNNPTIP
jgi:hypothetical protein